MKIRDGIREKYTRVLVETSDGLLNNWKGSSVGLSLDTEFCKQNMERSKTVFMRSNFCDSSLEVKRVFETLP